MPPENSKPKKAARSRARVSRPTLPGDVITTIEHAEEFAESIRVKLGRMVDAAALMRANRRRATAIDRVDFEAAFDDVVNATPRPKQLAFIGDVCGIFGAGFIGYSINIYTGPGGSHQVGHIAILSGLILSVAGICMKYIDPSR